MASSLIGPSRSRLQAAPAQSFEALPTLLAEIVRVEQPEVFRPLGLLIASRDQPTVLLSSNPVSDLK